MEKIKSKENGLTKSIETQKFYNDTTEAEIFNVDNDLQIHTAKEMIEQGVATLDYEDDGSGKPKSVTVTRSLDKKTIFYSEQERDIKKFLN